MKLDKYVNYRFACSYDAGKWMFGNRDYKVIPNCVNCDDFKYDTDRRNAKDGNWDLKINMLSER